MAPWSAAISSAAHRASSTRSAYASTPFLTSIINSVRSTQTDDVSETMVSKRESCAARFARFSRSYVAFSSLRMAFSSSSPDASAEGAAACFVEGAPSISSAALSTVSVSVVSGAGTISFCTASVSFCSSAIISSSRFKNSILFV